VCPIGSRREATEWRPELVLNPVYAGSGHEVKTVRVAGRALVRDGGMLTADERAIRTEAQVRAEEVARSVAAEPMHKEMALLEAMGKRWL
jgi:5-methylthioadenosine/S-adenosylhomocysteine deaminase